MVARQPRKVAHLGEGHPDFKPPLPCGKPSQGKGFGSKPQGKIRVDEPVSLGRQSSKGEVPRNKSPAEVGGIWPEALFLLLMMAHNWNTTQKTPHDVKNQ